MSATDAFVLVVRWLHIVVAAAWIGGCIFFLLMLGPAVRKGNDRYGAVAKAAAQRFRTLVDLSIVVLVASGAILAFNRLTDDATNVAYVTVLAVKVALSAWMFILVQMERRSSALMAKYETARLDAGRDGGPLALARSALSGYNGVTIIGIVVFLLSDVLRVLFEIALRSG